MSGCKRAGRTPPAAVLARVLVAGFATAGLLAGCGGSKGGQTSSTVRASRTRATTSTASAAHRARTHRRRPALTGAPLGHTRIVRAGTTRLKVTVTHVIDPLRDGGTATLPGTRSVAVRLTLFNAAGATYDSTASGDVSLLLSRGDAAPMQIRAGVCETPLVDFESLIGVGETRSGCVAFTVSRGVQVLGVRFSPDSHTRGSVRWRVR